MGPGGSSMTRIFGERVMASVSDPHCSIKNRSDLRA